MDTNFVNQLLIALDEQEIQDKIRSIIAVTEQLKVAVQEEVEKTPDSYPQKTVNIDLLKSTIDRLKNKKEELELYIQSLKEDNLSLLAKEKELWTKSEELETLMEQLKNENYQLKEVHKQIKLEKEQLSTSIQQIRAGSVNLEAENYRLKSKEREFSTKADNLEILLKQSNDENRQLREHNEKLEQEKELLSGTVHQLRFSSTRLEDSNVKLKAREQELIERSDMQRKTISFYESYYGNIDYFYRSYNNLEVSIHEELSGILSVENPEMFMACGLQWKNIETLWDFISGKFDVYDESQMYPLIEMCEYFFDIYVKVAGTYERLQVKVGQEFNQKFHTKSYNSKGKKGKILEVMLRGYQNKKDGVIKKSVVRI